ncbi:MAG: HTH-type transcriptional regulator, sugar sensing transcriptional regulator [Thermoplasmata archaeon]|jgi:sugar-specific transcriptional regulator TrmB|nr:HTH-type transcriptional regulator, sugar sensing transcriptional regulator [Thermoplasmata archaeon]
MTVNPQRISRLQEHGLTEYEARAYLALLELENSEASPIADLARVPRTKIYQALDGLEAKKLLQVIPDRPKRYQVAPIAAYIESLEANYRARADTLGTAKDTLVEEFAPKGRVQMERSGGFVVLKGRANISSKLCELMARANADFAVATSAMGAHRLAYHHDLLEQASGRGATVRVLAPAQAENDEAMEILSRQGEARHALVDLGAVTLAFVDDKEVMLVHHVPDDRHYFQGADVALWSDDPAIVQSLKALFTLGWGLSVPYAERHTAAARKADPIVASIVENLGREAKRLVVTA